MAAKKIDPKAKEKRQKMILAGGLVVLAVLMVVQGPKLLHHGPSAAPPPPTETTAPAGTTSSTLAPPSVAAAAPSAAAAAPTSGLADTEVAPVAQQGELVHFDLFASKDPFVQQVKDLGSGATPPSTGGKKSSGGSKSSDPFGGKKKTVPAKTALARMSVDGKAEDVLAGGDFPADAPVFHLESFGASSASITVVGGQYQDGRASLKLTKGTPLTLENMTDGTRYRVVYLGRRLVAATDVPAATATATAETTTAVAPTPTPTTTTTTTSSTPTAPDSSAGG